MQAAGTQPPGSMPATGASHAQENPPSDCHAGVCVIASRAGTGASRQASQWQGEQANRRLS